MSILHKIGGNILIMYNKVLDLIKIQLIKPLFSFHCLCVLLILIYVHSIIKDNMQTQHG